MRSSLVTHLLDRDFAFVLEFLHFDAIEHLIVYDHYCVHWVDISRCWLDARRPRASAPSNTAPGQPPEAKQPWGAWIDIHYADGLSATVRSVGGLAPRAPDARSGSTEPRGRSGAAFSSARTSSSWNETARPSASTSPARGTSTASRARWQSSCPPSPRAASRTTPDGTTSSRSS